MDKVITTVLLIVISMVMSLLLFNAAYPATMQASDSITRMADSADERMRDQIEVIHAAGELNQAGFWNDADGSNDFSVMLWVKNVGTVRTLALDDLDVFFGPEGGFVRIPHESRAGSSFPFWTYSVENGAEWTPTSTLSITVHYQTPLSAGRYFGKVVTPTGASSEVLFGL